MGGPLVLGDIRVDLFIWGKSRDKALVARTVGEASHILKVR